MFSSNQGIRKRQVVTLRYFDILGVLCITVLLYVLYVKLRQGTAKPVMFYYYSGLFEWPFWNYLELFQACSGLFRVCSRLFVDSSSLFRYYSQLFGTVWRMPWWILDSTIMFVHIHNTFMHRYISHTYTLHQPRPPTAASGPWLLAQAWEWAQGSPRAGAAVWSLGSCKVYVCGMHTCMNVYVFMCFGIQNRQSQAPDDANLAFRKRERVF